MSRDVVVLEREEECDEQICVRKDSEHVEERDEPAADRDRAHRERERVPWPHRAHEARRFPHEEALRRQPLGSCRVLAC